MSVRVWSGDRKEWSNLLIAQDILWVAALVAMGLFATIMARINLRHSAARWFGALIVAAGINIFGVVSSDLIGSSYLPGQRAIAIGRAFIPYATLGFSLVFPYRHKTAKSSWMMFVLAIPSLVTVVATDPFFATRKIESELGYLVVWMGVYFIWAYTNLFRSYKRVRLWITKRQHVLLSIAAIPTTAVHYLTSIVCPFLGYDDIWRYNWLPILAVLLIINIDSFQFGLSRRWARASLDRTISTAGLSTQMVAHAVKNSLQTIRSLAETAQGPGCPDANTRMTRIMTLCDELSERMGRLKLLSPAGIELELDKCLVSEPLEQAVARVRPFPPGIRLERDFCRPVPMVRTDRTHLEEVFVNLLVNAFEAMPGGGVLRLEIREETSWAIVGVHDQGIGISREQLKTIFEPFKTTKIAKGNWGIGLSYCHTVIERFGGTLSVESRPNQGSSFYVALPALGLLP